MKEMNTSEHTTLLNSWSNNQIIIQIDGEKSVQRVVKMMQQQQQKKCWEKSNLVKIFASIIFLSSPQSSHHCPKEEEISETSSILLPKEANYKNVNCRMIVTKAFPIVQLHYP